MGKRFDALRLDQRQAIIRGLFGNVEVLSFKEAGIEGVGPGVGVCRVGRPQA
jgi:hypothetical protein